MEELLDMAEALDGMDRDVASWEADFLESVLTRLRSNQRLTEKQEAKLRQIHEKYFEADGTSSPRGDEGVNTNDLFM